MTQKRKQYLAVLAGVLLTAGFWIYSLYGHQPIQRLPRPEQGTGSQETNLRKDISHGTAFTGAKAFGGTGKEKNEPGKSPAGGNFLK